MYSSDTLITAIKTALNSVSVNYNVTLSASNKIVITNLLTTFNSFTIGIASYNTQLKKILGFDGTNFNNPINLLLPYSLFVTIKNYRTSINYNNDDIHLIISVNSDASDYTRYYYENTFKQSIQLHKDNYQIIDRLTIKISRSDGFIFDLQNIDFEMLLEFTE